MAEDLKVVVDLKNNEYKLIETKKYELFDIVHNSNTLRYRLEGDTQGFSCIEKTNDEYFKKNYLKENETLKTINSKKITQREVIELIKENEEEIYENELWS